MKKSEVKRFAIFYDYHKKLLKLRVKFKILSKHIRVLFDGLETTMVAARTSSSRNN